MHGGRLRNYVTYLTGQGKYTRSYSNYIITQDIYKTIRSLLVSSHLDYLQSPTLSGLPLYSHENNITVDIAWPWFICYRYWGGLIVFANAIYFLAGIIIKQSKLPFTQIFQPSFLALIPIMLLCYFPNNLDRGTLAGIAITYLVIIISLYAHNYLPKDIKEYSYFIGRNTLVIFLFSPIFTILCKLFLPFLFFDSTGMLFMVISVIVTINGCIAIAWSMDKLHFSRFFFGQDNILN